MKIGYVHSVPFPSVDANVIQVVQMCRAFALCGHDVTLFIPRSSHYAADEQAREAAREIFSGELPFRVEFVHSFTLFGRLAVLGSVRSSLSALRRVKPDIVYTRNPWSVLFLPQTGLKYVFEAHEERIHMRSRLLDGFLRRIIVRNARKDGCVLMVAISQALARIWEGFGVPPQKLTSAHDAVELEIFEPDADKVTARNTLGITGHKPVVVYTGALKQDRGVDLMLDAAQALPEMDLYLIGGKSDEVDFWKASAEKRHLNNVHFTGRIAHRQIPEWLAAADILLMMWTWRVPTIRGCSPMKMFEYMAAQRLIVGPAFPTILEVLENGRDSILFEPDHREALIAALREGILRMHDPIPPKLAREKVERLYTWRARAEHILREVQARGNVS